MGGVTIPASTGLNIDSTGALSLNIGAGVGTVAAGNDSRLVNALQPDRVNTFVNQVAPATPAAGTTSCWVGAINKNWTCKNDSGTMLTSVVASSGTGNRFVTGINSTGLISYAQPAFSNLSGQIATSQLGGTVSGDLSGSLPSPSVVKINGTSIPPNSSTDQVILTTGAATGAWASLPTCTDSAGQHLNYDTSTHSFSCGTTAASTASATVTGGSCPTGQYATAISANGTPVCGTPAGSVASIFTQSGTGTGKVGSSTAPASLQISGPAPWIDVKAFGATGNGTTDDTVAIQNALNALPSSGGTVFFPCGTYLVGQGASNVGLTISASQFSFRLLGQAGTSWGSSRLQCARIVTASAITILTIGNGLTAQSGGFIEHLTFADISNSGAGGNAIGAIHMNCLSWFTLFDVELDWFANPGVNKGYGIFEDGGSDSNQYSNHNLIFRCRTQGVHYGLLIANGNHDGPDVIASQFTTSKVTSPNYGIYCAAVSCASLNVTNSKVTLWDANNAGVGVYLGGMDSKLFGLNLESYRVGSTGTCCQNTGLEVAGTATRNIIGMTSTRFANALQIDPGAARINIAYTLDSSSTNKIVNNAGNATVAFPACANQAGTALVPCP